MTATDAQLEGLLLEIESDRAERTVSTSDTDKFAEAICAFSNDMPNHRAPGYLFVGATPAGEPAGIEISDQLLQNLAAIRAQGNILPLPVMNVEKRILRGGPIAVVEVFPSDLPPVRYKGRVQIRVGPRKAIASEAEERILNERRAASARTWDARPCREASLADLSLPLFQLTYRPLALADDVIAENHRALEQQLAALRFFDARMNAPTFAGVLLFGKDPTFFVPGAYIQYVQYEGLDQGADVRRERRIDGDLLTVMRALDALAEDLAAAWPQSIPGALSEIERFEYPPNAMHELLMNAVIHRSYEASAPVSISHFNDRIEILNPGGLYDLTPDEFPNATAYRNPVIAEAAKTLGFVNRFGRGIDIANAALRKNSTSEVKFELHANHMLAVVTRGA